MATHSDNPMTLDEVQVMLEKVVAPACESAAQLQEQDQMAELDKFDADLSRTQQNIKAIDEQTKAQEAPTPSRTE